MLEDRIVEHVFMFCGNREIEAVEWLKKLGCRLAYASKQPVLAGSREPTHEQIEYHLDGLTGMRCGLTRSDPVTVAVQFGFLLAGPFWPHVYPRLLSLVNKRWKVKKTEIANA